MEYTVTMFLLLALYGLAICFMKDISNTKAANICFAAAVFVPYISHSLYICSRVGFYDWNFLNTLPTANVSPFMFISMPVILILPKRVQKYAFTLISLLSVGMLGSMIFNCVYNANIHYRFHPHFLLDYVAHVNLSLFGVYLVRSRQVSMKIRECLGGAAIILCAAATMLVMNGVFDTAFFGLSLRGRHNIYNMVLTENAYASALIYFAGLVTVMLLGFAYSKAICRFTKSTI